MAGLLIDGAMIIDGTGAPPRPETLFVDGERIAALGRKAGERAAGRNDIRRIDATGLTVMPGLIDAHCHITFDEPASNDELFFHRREGLAALIAARNVRKLLCAGVTAFFDADSLFELGIDLRDAIEAGIVEGPRMATGGNALLTSVGGTAGLLIPDEGLRGYAHVVQSREEIVREVRRQIKHGVDWIKVHVTGIVPRQRARGEITVWSLDELRAVADAAHDLGIPVVGHCRNANSTRDAARAGFDMILHATFMDEEALEAVVARKVPLVPTFTFQANLADYGTQVGADPGLQEIFRQEITGSAAMLKRAYDAGVPLLCGTETGFSLTPYGDWHYRELQIFVEDLGLTPLEAIRCGTHESARALGRQHELGRIEEGCLADLLVLDGDPSQDVTILGDWSRIRHVFLGGREIDRTREEPARKPVPGWRVSPYSTRILSWDAVHGKGGTS